MPRRLLAFVTFLTLISGAHASEIGVSPSRLSVVLPAGSTGTESIDLISTADTEQQISVHLVDWTLTTDGRVQFLKSGTGTNSSRPWIELQGETVQLPPKSTVPFRFTVAVPRDSKLNGTYHSMIVFDVGTPVATEQGKVQMALSTAIGVALYVSVAGTETNGSKLADMYADGTTVHAIVDNLGNTVMRYSGSIEVRDASGSTVKSVPIGDNPILRESERDVAVKMPELSKGYYVLLLLLKDSRGGLLTGQLPYEVP